MNPFLFDLALRGSLVTAVVLLVDYTVGTRHPTRWRRVAYFLVVVAWLVPFRLPAIPTLSKITIPTLLQSATEPANLTHLAGKDPAEKSYGNPKRVIWAIWLAGVLANFGLIGIRTARTARHWSRVRLSTNPGLLELLEDCKVSAQVTTPIALVATDDVSTPALLGWLRPRILLPKALIETISREQLRAILLHELAHFKAADIPMQWLFFLAQSLHWFNPLAYLATQHWKQFREVSADESALAWMPAANRFAYGEALIAAIRQANPISLPRGALALGESVRQLKLRMTMITRITNRPRSAWSAIVLNIILGGFIMLPLASIAEVASPGEAAKSAAQTATMPWLKTIDENDYAASWTNASSTFKTHITSDKWAAALQQARQPAGKLLERTLASSLYQNEVPQPNGEPLKGEFVIQQFNSSFENLRTARETVTFTKDTDGQWHAVGYYIAPH